MMNRSTLAIAGVALATALLASPVSGKDRAPPKKSPLIGALAACRQIADSTQRLACFDKASGDLIAATDKGDVNIVDRAELRQARRSLFGFNMPRLPFFSGDESADEAATKLVSMVTAVKEMPHNRYVVRLKDGAALWETLEAYGSFHAPKAGDAVEISRGPLGSYIIRFGKQRGVKARRVG